MGQIESLVGKRLYDLRRDRNLSQSDIGDILGVTYQQVQKYEKGATRLSATGILVLSKHFEIQPAYFFIDPANPPQDHGLSIIAPEGDDQMAELVLLYVELKQSGRQDELLNYAKYLVSRPS